MRVAIIYASHDGYTKKICQKIAEQLNVRADFHEVATCDASTITDYDVLIFGSAVRYGKHLKPMVNYLSKSRDLLIDKKTAFFSVNLTARKPNRDTPETSNYVKKMFAKLDWKPTLVDVFAGKLNYPHYRFFDKHIIRFIMWLTKGDTDLTTVKEYTDWDRVATFTARLNAMIDKG